MPTIGSRSGFSAFEPRRRRYPRQNGLWISAQRSADVTPTSWSSASDIRVSSDRSRSRLRHNCNAPRQRAKLGDVGPTAICGDAIRSMFILLGDWRPQGEPRRLWYRDASEPLGLGFSTSR